MWYQHNPGGLEAIYRVSDKEMEMVDRIIAHSRPANNERKRRLQDEDQEDEDPMHTPKRVAGSNSVRTILHCCVYAP